MNPTDTVVFVVGVVVFFIALWAVIASGVLTAKQRRAQTEADAPPEARPEPEAIDPSDEG